MLLFGTKSVRRELPHERKVCPHCLSVTDHTVLDDDTRFTLYFIPLFSLQHQVVYTCAQCGDSHTLPYIDYQASHLDPQPAADTAASDNPGSANQPKKKREKPNVILEGRVVGDEIKTSLPFSAHLNSDSILNWLYVTFAAIILLAALLLMMLFYLLSRR